MMIRVRSLPNSLKLVTGLDRDPAPAGGVGRPMPLRPMMMPPGGEVGAVDVLHQIGKGTLRVVQHTDPQRQ